MSEKVMAIKENPLVSIVVLTYNSEATVIETLDSIKDQTYHNLELIVSDDYSTDNTVEVCRKWIAENERRFVRTVLLEVPKNSGVSANCNRAEDECRGEWMKGIAGDDLLYPDAIDRYIEYAASHPDAFFMFAHIKAFGAREERCRYFEESVFDYEFIKRPVEEQLRRLELIGNSIPATTFFCNVPRYRELGVRNDERIPLLEDWPKWINMLKKGARFDVLDYVTVKYRISDTSLSNAVTHSLKFRQSNALLYIYYLFRPQFKASHIVSDRRFYVNKLIYAHHFVGDKKLFWRFSWALYSLGRLVKRQTAEMVFF